MPMPLSSDKLHLTMTKSSTFSGLRDALLAVTTFPAAENTLSDFELAAGTGKTILTRCERSVKYTLQLSWFTLPKTRPEPDPEPGLLTITRPEPDPKSKSATRQALLKSCVFCFEKSGFLLFSFVCTTSGSPMVVHRLNKTNLLEITFFRIFEYFC